MFVSTLAQASVPSFGGAAKDVSVQQIERGVVDLSVKADNNSKLDAGDQLDASKDDCPCKKHHGKMASIVCGVALAFSAHQSPLAQPSSVALRFEWSSDDMMDAYIKTLKRPPRATS